MVDPFGDVDSPQWQTLPQEDQPGPFTRNKQNYQEYIPMEEGEIGSHTDQEPSIRDVLAVTWAKHVGVKTVQYMKIGHASKIDAEEPNTWHHLGNAVRETENDLYGSAIINDRDDKRTQPPRDTGPSRTSAARKHARRVFIV